MPQPRSSLPTHSTFFKKHSRAGTGAKTSAMPLKTERTSIQFALAAANKYVEGPITSRNSVKRGER